jgi:hypothetical protein
MAGFSVGYYGSPSAFQWLKNGSPIAAATNGTLILGPVTTSDAANYTVLVSNLFGNATSASAALTIIPHPVIQSILQVKSNMRVTSSTVPGQTYHLQYKDNLADPVWHDLAPTIIATGSSYTFINPMSASRQRFFRVALAQAAAAARPVIQSMQLADGVVSVSWTTVAGHVYALQYADSVKSSAWHNVTPQVFATGTTATLSQPAGNSGQRFYRVALLP